MKAGGGSRSSLYWQDPPSSTRSSLKNTSSRYSAGGMPAGSARRGRLNLFGFDKLEHKMPDACSPSTGRAEGLQQQASPPRSATDPSRKTRGGRITKNAPQSQNATPRRAWKLARSKREAYDSPPQGHELRRSRRLAGESPEFDVLGGKGDATPAMPVLPVQPNPLSQLPPDPQKTSTSGPRSSRRAPKKATPPRPQNPKGYQSPGRQQGV